MTGTLVVLVIVLIVRLLAAPFVLAATFFLARRNGQSVKTVSWSPTRGYITEFSPRRSCRAETEKPDGRPRRNSSSAGGHRRVYGHRAPLRLHRRDGARTYGPSIARLLSASGNKASRAYGYASRRRKELIVS
jgi:hypothetical protein